MFNYNPKSLKAEEFINDGEIRETLAYAEAHKNDREMIAEILEKARATPLRCIRNLSVSLSFPLCGWPGIRIQTC